MRFGLTPGGGLNLDNVVLRQLIEFAYEVQPFQISGGPGWLNTARFTIVAKPPQSNEAPADIARLTDEQRNALDGLVRKRLQALLAERFQLAVHRDKKELPVYALVVTKNGHKLKESTADASKRM